MSSKSQPAGEANAGSMSTPEGDSLGTGHVPPTTSNSVRKRTKIGCLTCRKRRIKCGEEHPACANCIKTKRQCEGYNQRIVFKAPTGDWPNDPRFVSATQYRTSQLKEQSFFSDVPSQYQTTLKTPEEIKQEHPPLEQTKPDVSLDHWRTKAAQAAEGNKGSIQQLCISCLDALNVLIEESRGSKRELNILQRCQGNLRLWAHQHQVHNGTLDATLQRSASIWQTTLEFLVPLYRVVLQGLLGCDYQTGSDTLPQIQWQEYLRIYQQNRLSINGNRNASDSDSNSDSDSQSESESKGSNRDTRLRALGIGTAVRKIRNYTECLLDIGHSLEHPAVDDPDEEDIALLRSNQKFAEDCHTKRLKARFLAADSNMLQGLGRANFDRFQRMEKQRELHIERRSKYTLDSASGTAGIEQLTLNKFQASTDALLASGYLSRFIGVALRLSPLPSILKARNGAFKCIGCSDVIRCADSYDWREHLYADLKLYTCFFADCSFITTPFPNRQAWATHLELQHSLGPSWKQTECPFCSELISEGKDMIVGHLSQHMEEIALASMLGSRAPLIAEPGMPPPLKSACMPCRTLGLICDQQAGMICGYNISAMHSKGKGKVEPVSQDSRITLDGSKASSSPNSSGPVIDSTTAVSDEKFSSYNTRGPGKIPIIPPEPAPADRAKPTMIDPQDADPQRIRRDHKYSPPEGDKKSSKSDTLPDFPSSASDDFDIDSFLYPIPSSTFPQPSVQSGGYPGTSLFPQTMSTGFSSTRTTDSNTADGISPARVWSENDDSIHQQMTPFNLENVGRGGNLLELNKSIDFQSIEHQRFAATTTSQVNAYDIHNYNDPLPWPGVVKSSKTPGSVFDTSTTVDRRDYMLDPSEPISPLTVPEYPRTGFLQEVPALTPIDPYWGAVDHCQKSPPASNNEIPEMVVSSAGTTKQPSKRDGKKAQREPSGPGLSWVVTNNPEELKSRKNMTTVRKRAMRTFLETSGQDPRNPRNPSRNSESKGKFKQSE